MRKKCMKLFKPVLIFMIFILAISCSSNEPTRIKSPYIPNFIGAYEMKETAIVEDYPNHYEINEYTLDILESTENSFDIQFYFNLHGFIDTIKSIVKNDSTFTFSQKYTNSVGNSINIFGKGNVNIMNDSIKISYRVGSPNVVGVLECEAIGIKKQHKTYLK